MSSRSRQSMRGAKSPVRGAKGKGARRAPVKSSTDVPVMAVVVGAVLLVVFVGLLIIGFRSHQSTSLPAVQGSSGTIPCDQLEQTQVHYHAALQILDSNGTLHPLPGGAGIIPNENAPRCYYWLHVHAAYPNVIHIESPATRVFTLGDFFKVWDAWSTQEGGPHQVLSSSQVSTLTVGTGQQMVVYIDLNDGKGPQPYTGDPSAIQLKSHETITIEIVSGKPYTPPKFDWTSSTNNGL